jgi:hypothetical protein
MKLPGGDRAIVDIAKVRDNCLNPAHHADGIRLASSPLLSD